MKQLVEDIKDMINNGYDYEDISYVLGVSQTVVKTVGDAMDAELEASYDSPERWQL